MRGPWVLRTTVQRKSAYALVGPMRMLYRVFGPRNIGCSSIAADIAGEMRPWLFDEGVCHGVDCSGESWTDPLT